MIIDTHQHFWNIDRPWAKGVQDYRILAEPEGITGTILRLEENETALEIADREPFVVGVCGQVIPGPVFESELNKFAANPLYRGICLFGPVLVNVERNKNMFLACMEQLAAKDMPLDLLRVLPGFWGGPKAMQQFQGTKESVQGLQTIAECVPTLRIVIQHMGGLPIDGKPITAEWEEKFQMLAKYPQIMIKVSGLMRGDTTRAQNERSSESLAFYRPLLDALWRIFGEDRLMYGSNWPVSEHEGDFISQSIRIVRRYFSEKGQVAYDKYFWKNSLHTYKWSPRMTAQTYQ
jgi:predicted TIM-barrel fold metal-dependent hydrolase